MEELNNMLQWLEGLTGRIGGFDGELDRLVEEKKDVILQLNRDQLKYGRDSGGNLLTPDYLSDPYFKTPEAAQDYANMKYRLEAGHWFLIKHPLNYPGKPKNTPNLIVRGDFQHGMHITTGAGRHTIDSTYDASGDIESKYNDKVFGLSPEAVRYLWEVYLANPLFGYVWDVDA